MGSYGMVTPKGVVFRPKCLKTTPFGVTTQLLKNGYSCGTVTPKDVVFRPKCLKTTHFNSVYS